MGQDINTTTVGQSNRVWKIFLAVLCFGILAYGYLYSKNTTGDFAFLFGYSLPSALFIWGIFHWVVGRKQGNKKAWFSFLAIFGTLIVSGLIGYSQQKGMAIQAITEIQRSFASMMKSGTNAQGLQQRSERGVDVAPTTKGDLGEMERFMKTFMNKIASQRNDYLLELDAVGWTKILEPERVRQDNGLIESKFIIQRAKNIVAKYKISMHTILNNARKDINTLNVSEEHRASVLRGFDNSMAKTGGSLDTLWDLEAETISEFENIITLLSERNGEWAIKDGQILFKSPEDLNTFNSYLAAIKDLAGKESMFQKQGLDSMNDKFNKMKNLE